MRLTDEVRANAARIAANATSVRIVPDRLAAIEIEPVGEPEAAHHLVEAGEEDTARYVLCLTAINFGSGWWPTIRRRPGLSGYFTMATGLTERFRAHGAWTNAELRAVSTHEIADALGQDPGHELMALYAEALRQLGRWLGSRPATTAIQAAGRSAERLAESLAAGMPFFADRGFYKRAQICGPELERFGVAEFDDLARLTLFADNLVPHVLRVDRALEYAPALARRIDAEQLLPYGSWSARSAAVACTPSSSSRSSRASTPTSSTWRCGRAGRPRSTRPARATATGRCSTEPR